MRVAAPHRGAGPLRRQGQRRRARRARVQRAAPPPEDRRGDAVAGAVLRGRGGRGAAARRSSRRRSASSTSVGYVGAGTVEFVASPDGRALLPRGQRAPPGRALRDRDGAPGSTSSSSRSASPPASGSPRAVLRRDAARPRRSRRASTPRIPAKRFAPAARTRSSALVWPDGRGRSPRRDRRRRGARRHAVLRPDARQDRRLRARRATRRSPGSTAPSPRRGSSSSAPPAPVATNLAFLRKVLAAAGFREGALRHDLRRGAGEVGLSELSTRSSRPQRRAPGTAAGSRSP